MLGLHKNKIMLCEYDEYWQEAYEKEMERLTKLLDDKIAKIKKTPKIEQVGSTALNIVSKPIIDIALVIADKNEYTNVYKILKNFGYDIIEGENNSEMIVWKGLPESRSHCIYIFFGDDKKYNEMVALREYFKQNQEELYNYETFKLSTLENSNSREQYEQTKKEYLDNIVKKING